MPSLRRSLAALSTAALVALPGTAAAQDPTLDSSTPGVAEYLLPHEQVRDVAADGRAGRVAPDHKASGAPSTEAPLFGTGVQPRRSARAERSARPAASGPGAKTAEPADAAPADAATTDGAPPRARPAGAAPDERPATAAAAPAPLGGSAPLTLIAVLAGGLALGFALRRRPAPEA